MYTLKSFVTTSFIFRSESPTVSYNSTRDKGVTATVNIGVV